MISQSLPTSLSTAALVLMPPPASSACHHPPRANSRSMCPAPRVSPLPLASGQHGTVGLMMVIAPAEPRHAEPLAELAEDMARFYVRPKSSRWEVRLGA